MPPNDMGGIRSLKASGKVRPFADDRVPVWHVNVDGHSIDMRYLVGDRGYEPHLPLEVRRALPGHPHTLG